MPIPNPHNGFVPVEGQKVRVVGACHPHALGKIHKIVRVVDCWYESVRYHHGEEWYSGGELGGLEPVPDDTPTSDY